MKIKDIEALVNAWAEGSEHTLVEVHLSDRLSFKIFVKDGIRRRLLELCARKYISRQERRQRKIEEELRKIEEQQRNRD